MVALKTKVTGTINMQSILSKFKSAVNPENVAHKVAEDSNRYIMEDTGRLKNSMEVVKVSDKHSQIIWNPVSPKGEQYAKAAYWTPQTSVKTEKNPLAHSMWFHFAKSIHLDRWLK